VTNASSNETNSYKMSTSVMGMVVNC